MPGMHTPGPVRLATRKRRGELDRDGAATAVEAGAAWAEAVDWSRTALGPVETWPGSLRAYVGMVMAMPTPAILFWGPEQLQIYNAGYAAIMGPRHPRYFAARYRDCWPETYATIHPWMQDVLQRGAVKQVEQTLFTLTRHGFTEEAYFTFTFSPVHDDEGAVAGVFQPVTEVTRTVLQERRTRALRDLVPRLEMTGALRDDAAAAAAVLAADGKDIPFSLVFANDDATARPALIAASGVAAGPPSGDVTDDLARAVDRVLASREPVRIDDVAAALGAPHVGPWGDPTSVAWALPLGRAAGAPPLGVIVLGVSPRLAFDDAYRAFFESVARQVTTYLLASRARRRERELLASEHELRQAAEAASRAKDEFLAVLGHELRNPLSPIVSATELLRRQAPADAKRLLDVVERQSRHMMRIVDDLLDISRIARGQIDLKKERIELASIVADAVELSRPLFARNEQEIVTADVPHDSLAVDADPHRLVQVVANLLANAAKYSPGRTRVVVAAERRGDRVAMRVRDAGIGIAPEVLPHVFDMFVQAPQAIDRAQGGLGLGLAIVKSLVELHGGTVEAHSEGRHRGSEFVVWLPLAADRAERDDAPRERAPECAPLSRRVLVVDDNQDAAELLADLLADVGCVTRTAYDGPNALRVASDFHPDVALLDIGLPLMDGFELARRLREQEHDLRLIAVTGYGQPSDRRQSQAAGFEGHLVKPIDFGELRELLEAPVSRH